MLRRVLGLILSVTILVTSMDITAFAEGNMYDGKQVEALFESVISSAQSTIVPMEAEFDETDEISSETVSENTVSDNTIDFEEDMPEETETEGMELGDTPADNPANTDIPAIEMEVITSDFGDFTINANGVLTDYSGTATDIVIPDEVVEIDKCVFQDNTTIVSVTMPDSVTTIGNRAFDGCTSLKDVTLSKGLKTIGYQAFLDCTALEEIEIPKSIEKVVETSIASMQGAFNNCVNLKTITFEEGTTYIPQYLFANCTGIESIVIPEGITKLHEGAFYQCSALTEITLPETLIEIGNYAFRKSGLSEEVVLPQSLTTIGNQAFAECVGVMKIAMPDSVTTIGNLAFDGCTSLKDVILSKGLKTIGYQAFLDCTALEEIEIPKSIEKTVETSIASMQGVFNNCVNLKTVTFEEGITYIPQYLFANCTGLESIVIPEGVTELHEGAFYQCTALVDITIPESVTELGKYTFEGCSALKSINIPETVTQIKSGVFDSCTALKNVRIPDGITSISINLFQNCTALEKIEIPTSVTTVGDYAFKGCTNLKTIVMPDSLTKLANGVFQKCSSIKELILPKSITSIGTNVFDGCSNIVGYCYNRTKAATYMIDNNIPIVLLENDVEDSADLVFDYGNTVFDVDLENISASGYIKCRVDYNIKEEWKSKLTNKKIQIRIPANTELIEDSIRLDGVLCTGSDYTYSSRKLSIPVSNQTGQIEYYISIEDNKSISTYAQIQMSKSGVTKYEVIDVICNKVDAITVSVPQKTPEKTIEISGIAPKSALVTIEVDGVPAATAMASKTGKYTATIQINPTGSYQMYSITASCTQDEQYYSAAGTMIYEEGTPRLTDFRMYYSNYKKLSQINLLDPDKKLPVMTFRGGPYSFTVEFENPDNVHEVYITSTRNNIKKYLKAEYDEKTGKYVASGHFEDTSKSYVPGKIAVQYTQKHEQAKVNQNVNWELLNENASNKLKDCEVIVAQEDGYVNYKMLLSSISPEAAAGDPILNMGIKTFDEIHGQILSDYISVLKSTYDVASYILPGENNEKYQAYLVDEGTDMILLICDMYEDSASLVQNAVELKISIDGEDLIWDSIDEFAYEFGMTNDMLGLVFGAIGIYQEEDDLISQIMSSGHIQDKEEAVEKAKELSQDKLLFSLMSTVFPVVLGAVGVSGAPLLLFTGMMAIFSAASQLCWDQRVADITGTPFQLKWIIDPSGYVYEGVTENRLENVKTTVYYKEKLTDTNSTLWDASEYEQENPLYTDSEGRYAWDVPEGWWQVEYVKDGYETVYSEWMEVPPPRTEVNVGMISTEAPVVSYLHVFRNYAEVEFSQYMDPSTIDNMVLTDGTGEKIAYTLEYSCDETDAQGNVFAKYYKYVYDERKLAQGTQVEVTLADNVLNYAGSGLTMEASNYECIPNPELYIQSDVRIMIGNTLQIPFKITNYTGQEVTCVSDFEEIVNVAEVSVNENGEGFVSVSAYLYGSARLQIAVEALDIVKELDVSVLDEEAASFAIAYYDGTEEIELYPNIVYCDSKVNLPVPEKDMYDFAGWYMTPDLTGNPITMIEIGADENIILYAKWEIQNVEGLGDVLPEDLPESGIEEIPEGLWIGGLKTQGYEYTGYSITPTVRVYDGTKCLKNRTDYTLSYKDNIRPGTATIVIDGKGNYEGTVTKSFTILAKPLSDEDIMAYELFSKANNRVQKKIPTVTWNGKKLRNNLDYTVEYPDMGEAGAYKEPGTYDILITGKGNFTGEKTVTLTITGNELISKVFVGKIEKQAYTGSEITPELIIRYGLKELVKDVDYTVVFKNNIEIGTATATITGIGNYCGTKTVSFEIEGTPISKATVTGIPTSVVYCGETVTTDSDVWEQDLKLTIGTGDAVQTLVQGTDYEISYQNNVDKGIAKITFTGMKAYSGKITKTFRIHAYDIREDVSEKMGVSLYKEEVDYTKGGSRPKPVVMFGDVVLTENKDYTLRYKNNTGINDGSDENNIPTIIITGKGNFSGNLEKTFTIIGGNISELEMEVEDKVFVNSSGLYESEPVIVDTNGQQLKKGKDYSETITYCYKEDTTLTDGVTVRKAGDIVEEEDIIPTGTVIEVIAIGKGNYEGLIKNEYRIVEYDINKAKISVEKQDYTGYGITLDEEDMTVKYGDKVLVLGTDYEIVSYEDNVERGKAKVTIRGVGEYGRTKTIKFTIKSKLLEWWEDFVEKIFG